MTIQILSNTETNSYANAALSRNGGGYFQPLYTFLYDGIQGSFLDSSCGDFGVRYDVEWDGKYYMCDYVSSTSREESNFTDSDIGFINAFLCEFGFRIRTAEECEQY